MNSEFDKYVNSLNEITNQENRTELESFYTLHSATLQFFKAIDKTIQDILKKSNVGETVITQLENVLPTLTELKKEISKLDSETFAVGYKSKISQSVTNIKNGMTLSETNDTAQDFFELLKENREKILTEERENKEREVKLTPLQRAEIKILSQGASSCDAGTLWKLAEKSKNVDVLKLIVQEKPLHADNDDAIIESYGAECIRSMIASNPKIPVELLRILASDEHDEVRYSVAENHKTPIDILQILASDEDWHVRCTVAGHPNANTDLLHILTRDRDARVRISVAQNAKTPIEILHLLVRDTEASVRASIIESPNITIDLFRILAQDTDATVRISVAHNVKTPTNILHLLAQDVNHTVRHCLIDSPNITADLLRILAQDTSSTIRYSVATNGKTPIDILHLLARDRDAGVRIGVTQNANQSATQKVKNKSGCFVATACYGNYNAPEVLILRAYRDERLLTNWFGTVFVKFYYFVSPPLARQIEKSNKIKNFIRKQLLQPIVNKIKSRNENEKRK